MRPFAEESALTHQGRALAVLRSTGTPESVTVTVTAEAMDRQTIELQAI